MSQNKSPGHSDNFTKPSCGSLNIYFMPLAASVPCISFLELPLQQPSLRLREDVFRADGVSF